jgi:predicted dehydrogenase
MTQIADRRASDVAASATLGVAVVGCGYWGPNLIRNFGAAPTSSVTVACDKDPERLKAVADGDPKIALTTDYEDVLREASVDAVAIATPAIAHYEMVAKALAAGKHVWVEKPLTLDYGEASRLAELAAKKGLALMVDHIFTYTPAVRFMREALGRGELGDSLYFDSTRVKRGGALPEDVDVVWDMGVHDIYMMDHLLPGEPEGVCAVGGSHAGPDASMAHVTVQFSGGAIGHFYVNWVAPAKMRLVTLCGSRRAFVYDDAAPEEKLRAFEGGLKANGAVRPLVEYASEVGEAVPLEASEPLQEAVRHFNDCVINGRSPLTDGEAGARTVALAKAAQESLRAGGRMEEVTL